MTVENDKKSDSPAPEVALISVAMLNRRPAPLQLLHNRQLLRRMTCSLRDTFVLNSQNGA